MAYVFYNKMLKEIFDEVCHADTDTLRGMCVALDKDLLPYKLRKVYSNGKYIIEKNGEPIDEYGYFAKTAEEIKIWDLQEAIDFIDWLKENP